MSVEFENGMQGVVEGAQYVQYGYDARVEILGTEGVICLGDVHEKKVLTVQRTIMSNDQPCIVGHIYLKMPMLRKIRHL